MGPGVRRDDTDGLFRRFASPQGAVIVRLDRTIQYAAAFRFILKRLWNTGSSAGACHRAARCADPVADDDGWRVATQLRIPAARCARVVEPSAQERRGRRGMPGAQCTHSLACEIKQSTRA